MKKIFFALFIPTISPIFAQNVGLPAPAYLSDPNFLECKDSCQEIEHDSYTSLDMTCINACMQDLADGKSERKAKRDGRRAANHAKHVGEVQYCSADSLLCKVCKECVL